MDGVAAPATDTVANADPAPAAPAFPVILLGVIGAAAFVGGLRLTTVRARR